MKKGSGKMQYTVSHKMLCFLGFFCLFVCFFPRITIKFHFVCIFRWIYHIHEGYQLYWTTKNCIIKWKRVPSEISSTKPIKNRLWIKYLAAKELKVHTESEEETWEAAMLSYRKQLSEMRFGYERYQLD